MLLVSFANKEINRDLVQQVHVGLAEQQISIQINHYA